MVGPLGPAAKYVVEGAVQNGKVGPASQRAYAWVATVTRSWTAAGKPLDVLAEYKFASGSRNPADTSRSGTFDQLYAANHDRFGHQDLFGWRNIHAVKTLATYTVAKNLALNFMYDDFWLASAVDYLYNGGGKAIARSADGKAGQHVGRETDFFGTWRHGHFLAGAGYGYLFAGEFVRRTTPGVRQSYIYFFHTYSL